MTVRAAVAAFIAAFASLSANARPFTIDDALAIKEVSDARISPDGTWIAYVETRNDQDKDETASRIFIVSRDGAETIAMTGETYSASDPRWSPDGQYLSFIAARTDLDADAAAQVYTLNLKGGEAEAYTSVCARASKGTSGRPMENAMLLVIRDESAGDSRSAHFARNWSKLQSRGHGSSTGASSRKTASAISTAAARIFISSTSVAASRGRSPSAIMRTQNRHGGRTAPKSFSSATGARNRTPTTTPIFSSSRPIRRRKSASRDA